MDRLESLGRLLAMAVLVVVGAPVLLVAGVLAAAFLLVVKAGQTWSRVVRPAAPRLGGLQYYVAGVVGLVAVAAAFVVVADVTVVVPQRVNLTRTVEVGGPIVLVGALVYLLYQQKRLLGANHRTVVEVEGFKARGNVFVVLVSNFGTGVATDLTLVPEIRVDGTDDTAVEGVASPLRRVEGERSVSRSNTLQAQERRVTFVARPLIRTGGEPDEYDGHSFAAAMKALDAKGVDSLTLQFAVRHTDLLGRTETERLHDSRVTLEPAPGTTLEAASDADGDPRADDDGEPGTEGSTAKSDDGGQEVDGGGQEADAGAAEDDAGAAEDDDGSKTDDAVMTGRVVSGGVDSVAENEAIGTDSVDEDDASGAEADGTAADDRAVPGDDADATENDDGATVDDAVAAETDEPTVDDDVIAAEGSTADDEDDDARNGSVAHVTDVDESVESTGDD